MADALVEALNRHGYQPVFARTGLVPPDVYTYERKGRSLALRLYGDLGKLTGPTIEPPAAAYRMHDIIAGSSTSGKKLAASVSFLEQVLRCIGISSVPKLDLGFAGSSELTFTIGSVSALSVQPAEIQPLLGKLDLAIFPPELVERQRLYVAYEYLFADEIRMARADQQAFSTAIQGNLGEFVDVGGEADVHVERESAMVFTSKDGAKAAFAMKLGRIDVRGDARYLALSDVTAGTHGSTGDTTQSVIPRRNAVLELVDDAADAR